MESNIIKDERKIKQCTAFIFFGRLFRINPIAKIGTKSIKNGLKKIEKLKNSPA